MAKKRLCRSSSNKILAGVCAGFGDYFDLDPVLIRLIWVLLTIFTAGFLGVVAYIIAVIIMSEK